ncbi:calcium-binding protein, partial [Lutimaribacter marinistellae]
MSILTNGTPGNDTISTGPEDDIINGLGGEDIIESGAGNDTVNPGENNSFDYTDTGAGDDVVILTDTGAGFQVVGFSSLPTGVTVNIDGVANSATIDKGANGTTTVTDVQVAMLAGGFMVQGSNHDDVFNLTGVDGGFAMMRGMAGDDTFNIVAGPGTVRLDYRATSVATGIVADLSTGIVSEDGFGGRDTITGDTLDQIRGTNLDDTILGSAEDDHIRGSGGNDSLTGGDGSDTLRGGAGDDVLNPGDNDDFDEVDPGAGNDTIILSDLANGHVFLGNFELESGITVNVDGAANTGSVDKGTAGTTSLVDVQTPMLGGGVGIAGSNFDDVFNVTVAEGGFAYVRGYAGNDTFNISDDAGRLRLDYKSSSVSNGVVADLGAGIVSEDGFGGSDTITGASVDRFRGTDLDDSISGGSGDDGIEGVGGNDTIFGRGGDDFLDGGDGNDILNAGDGADTLRGGSGDDTLVAGNSDGYSELDSGSGDDRIEFAGTTVGSFVLAHFSLGSGVSIMVDGASNTGSIDKGANGTTTLVDVRNPMESEHLWLFGSSHDDTITATASDDGDIRIRGYAGNDTIEVGTGPGRVRLDYDSSSISNGIVADFGAGMVSEDGFGGSDTISGGPVWEYRGSRLDDDITLTDGDDRLRAKDGNDTVDGGAGHDTVLFDSNAGDASITETAPGSGVIRVISAEGTDLLSNVEELEFNDTALLVSELFPAGGTIEGTPGADTLQGTEGDDEILGLAGNDVLRGLNGADCLDGGPGADTLNGGDGDDTITGGPDGHEADQRDVIYAGAGNDLAEGGGGNDQIFGQEGNDTLA